jgi:hypothetical protein
MVTTTTFTGSGAGWRDWGADPGVDVQAVVPINSSSGAKTFNRNDPVMVLFANTEEEINWCIGFP